MLLFLSNLNMNQPYICPLPLETPSHLSPHPTPLGWHRAPVWVSWAIQQMPIGYLFYIWSPPVLMWIVSITPFDVHFICFFLMEQEMAWNSGKYNMNFGVRFLWLGAQGGYVPELLWDSVSLFVKWVNICDLVKVWQSNDTSKGNELSTWSIRALSEEKLIL